jgi:hypothetical protein
MRQDGEAQLHRFALPCARQSGARRQTMSGSRRRCLAAYAHGRRLEATIVD